MTRVETYATVLTRRADGILEHPLWGRSPHRTRLGVAFLLAIVGLYGVRQVTSAVRVGAALEPLDPLFYALADALILAVAATITVLPIAYAVWNGGPVLSFLGPVVPVALGDLLAGSYVLDLDVVVALTAGATAAAVAVYAADVRDAGTWVPWRDGVRNEDGLLFATAATVVAAVGALRFVRAMPAYVVEWYAPFAVLWVVAVAILLGYWCAWLRPGGADRPDVGAAD